MRRCGKIVRKDVKHVFLVLYGSRTASGAFHSGKSGFGIRGVGLGGWTLDWVGGLGCVIPYRNPLVTMVGTPSGSKGLGFEALNSAKAVCVTSRGDRGFVPGFCKVPV